MLNGHHIVELICEIMYDVARAVDHGSTTSVMMQGGVSGNSSRLSGTYNGL
jgi:hypothetical protein